MEVPVGRGRRFGSGLHSIVDAALGGWQVAGFLRYQTGRPFTVYSCANTLAQSTVDCNTCSPDDRRIFTNSAGVIQVFGEATRNTMSTPAAGSIGNTGRKFFTLTPTFNMDASLSKRFFIREGMDLQVRADATNLPNTPVWDTPTAVRTSPSFGNLTQPLETSGSRKIQLGAKFNF